MAYTAYTHWHCTCCTTVHGHRHETYMIRLDPTMRHIMSQYCQGQFKANEQRVIMCLDAESARAQGKFARVYYHAYGLVVPGHDLH